MYMLSCLCCYVILAWNWALFWYYIERIRLGLLKKSTYVFHCKVTMYICHVISMNCSALFIKMPLIVLKSFRNIIIYLSNQSSYSVQQSIIICRLQRIQKLSIYRRLIHVTKYVHLRFVSCTRIKMAKKIIIKLKSIEKKYLRECFKSIERRLLL